MAAPSSKHVTVIGAGKIGSSLALALKSKGFTIDSVVSASLHSAAKLSRLVRAHSATTSLRGIPSSSGIIVLSVPDERLERIAADIAHENGGRLDGRFIFHTSGVRGVAILDPLRGGGANIAAIHPVQSFRPGLSAQEGKRILKNIRYGVDASGDSLKQAKKLIRVLGGRTVIVPERLRPLYHLTCVFASGHLVTLLGVIERLSVDVFKDQAWQEVFRPLIETSIGNALRLNPQDALTGPARRGDNATIELHQKDLRKLHPEFLPLYAELTRQAKQISPGPRASKKKR